MGGGGRDYGYGSGSRDSGMDLGLQLIKSSFVYGLDVKPARGTLPLALLPFPTALFSRQTH